MSDDRLTHPYPHGIAEMHHVVERFRLPPLAYMVGLLALACSHAKPVKSWCGYAAVLPVVELDPVVKFLQN